MNGILDFPGLIAAFVLALIIVVPVLVKALRQQNVARTTEPGGSAGAAGAPVAAWAVADCPSCGQRNRVPLDAPRAQCGQCKADLRLSTPA